MERWKHFKTITKHRRLVRHYCFRVGLYWQGLTHDLSKYSRTEFIVGAKYYQGYRSPNVGERNDIGYSTAWLHHKGRNKHHFEYWIDYLPGSREVTPVRMPPKYLVEMCMDRIAACRVYHGDDYTDADPWEYLHRGLDNRFMHPDTKRELDELLTILKDQGEQALFDYIRNNVLRKGKDG